ncbi:MAG: hypothetical protein O3B84_04475, partial [Chloroflexi bacterium]|nr:hypothetical protein [Chloroflexota bacterium]
ERQPGGANESGGDTRIKDVADAEPPFAVEASDIVVRAMDDFLDPLIRHEAAKGLRILDCQRVNDGNTCAVRRHLDEAQLFRVAVPTVSFCVERDGRSVVHDPLNQRGKSLVRGY